MIFVDSHFYQRLVVAPWQLVRYNVFPSGDHSSSGPDIFGTEPWWFYALNGFLNLNVVFPLALISLPVLFICKRWAYQAVVGSTGLGFLATSHGRPYLFLGWKLLGAYLWLVVFTLQAHKEERFLYVVYPLFCFNAATVLVLFQQMLLHVSSSSWVCSILLEVSRRTVVDAVVYTLFIALVMVDVFIVKHLQTRCFEFALCWIYSTLPAVRVTACFESIERDRHAMFGQRMVSLSLSLLASLGVGCAMAG